MCVSETNLSWTNSNSKYKLFVVWILSKEWEDETHPLIPFSPTSSWPLQGKIYSYPWQTVLVRLSLELLALISNKLKIVFLEKVMILILAKAKSGSYYLILFSYKYTRSTTRSSSLVLFTYYPSKLMVTSLRTVTSNTYVLWVHDDSFIRLVRPQLD